MYAAFRKLLFLLPPEQAHHLAMQALEKTYRSTLGEKWLAKRFSFTHPSLSRELMGLHFPNPVGLAAGFDKNAAHVEALAALGFGFIEIGTVTPQPQEGNPRPRLFRLVKDNALINRMGFNNDGVLVVAGRLREIRRRNQGLIIGGNISKNRNTPNEQALIDYGICFDALYDTVDYFVINVSSPNTPGLRELQQKSMLREIIHHLQMLNEAKPQPRPLLLKIAPDLHSTEIDQILDVALHAKLAGIIAANTTIHRRGLRTHPTRIQRIGAGGLSGKPLFAHTLHMVQHIVKQTAGQLPVIASGGIFSPDDACIMLDAGASLVQIYTGLIYQGPSLVKQICIQLARA